MPLIVKDFKWQQSKTFVTIHVPLHGIHQSKVDIFTSSKYIKASFDQYFFEAFLFHEINKAGSCCTLTETEIIFELLKCKDVEWEKLETDIPKSEKLCLKKKIIDEEHQTHQSNLKDKRVKKGELKRVAVREQISLDTRQRESIEQIKDEEKRIALGDLNHWQCPKVRELSSDEEDDPKIIQKPVQQKSNKQRNIFKNTHSEIPVPLPRKSGSLTVDFTPRAFPTPSRESLLDEEKEWLRKQAEVRRSVGFVSEDLRAEEKNPQYLKSKGDEFLKAGNYLAAISAYSFGIKLSERFVDLYICRSEAHFEQGNYYKSIRDCTTAIELMVPVVQANFVLRTICIARRGMALCKMGLVREGISELEAALSLDPYNKKFKLMLVTCKQMLNENV